MKRRLLILTLAASLFGFTASPSSFSQEDATATIVCWNINGFTPISDSKAEVIARAILDLDPEVIALSEVNRDDVPDKIADKLDSLGVEYNSTLLDQTASLNLAILHKDGVEVTGAQLIPGSDDNNSFLRKALAANVKVGNFDFILIAVHNKANRDNASRAVRSRQCTAIANFIATATAGSEKDVLVIGDYNMRPDQDGVNFTKLNPAGFLRFISTQDLSGQVSHITNCSGFQGSLLDGYAISKDHTAEYVGGSLRIYPIHRALGLTCSSYQLEVSDRLPLVARFRILGDDD